MCRLPSTRHGHLRDGLGVDIATMTKTSTGLYYKNKVVGSGAAAQSGDSVRVHYTLWLTNGTKVQSSKDNNGAPLEFLTGGRRVASSPASRKAVIGMQPGGVRQLVIPPRPRVGSDGFPPVQPNANVVFEIEYLGRL